MTPSRLLKELEPLTHDGRVRRMVEVGRLASTDSSGADTLDSLERGTFYERRLALVSCFGSRDGSRVLRALDDASRHIRGLARRLVPLACDDRGAIQALDALRSRERRALCKHLYNTRRWAPIDAFMTALAKGRDDALSDLLPYASRPIVEQYLEVAFDRAGPDAWKRLARLHPELAVARLLERAQQTEGFDKRLVWHVNTVLSVLSRRSPDLGLSLVREMSRTTSLPSLALQGLVDRRPEPIAEMLLASGDVVRVTFDRVAHRLSAGLLINLASHHPALLARSDLWFQKMPLMARREVFVALQLGWRNRDGVVGHATLAQLSADLREQEGQRHIDLPVLRTRTSQRLPYASLLRWEEARDVLDPFIRNPDADLRSVALRALIDATRYHRDRLPEILALIRARRNEQDPVRLAMLTALANLPPSRWRSEHLDDLASIVSDALAASDLSPSTAHAAERLIVALLPFHSDWSVRWIATLVRERGRVSMYGLEDRLTDDLVRRLAPTLLPVLEAWATREREGQLVGVAQAFGRRLRVFPALVSLLERVLTDTRSAWTADIILSLLRQHRPERLATIVPRLVRDDPSAIVLMEVSNFLHRRRQDVLTPFLGRSPGNRRLSLGRQGIRGRFATGKTRYVPPYSDGFHRWTATQQETFARTLRELIGDPERDSPAILFAINQLSGLQAVKPTRLIELADARNPKPAVRDAALRALGRLDSGEGVPVLLEATRDDRGRVAIYALRRALLSMPENRALPFLLGVRMEKVTVAKEVVRLIGELRGEDAYRELLSIERDELHRDVRVALLRALWDHLERDETWPVLDRAATSEDDAVARGVVRIPADRLSVEAQRKLSVLLATLLRHPEPRVRVEVLERLSALPILDSDRTLLPPLMHTLESQIGDERRAAGSAVFSTYAGRETEPIREAVQRFRANRRVLESLISALTAQLRSNRGQLGPTTRVVMEALEPDPLTVGIRIELGASVLPWEEMATLLVRLAESGDLHAEALMRTVRVITGSGHAGSRADTAELGILERALWSRQDERLRRIGLAALVGLAAPPRGWNAERLARLRAYRQDPSPLVAGAAQFTLPTEELVDQSGA